MIHFMHLAEEPFKWMREGKKKIEVRLWDEKRKKIKPGDYIVFLTLDEKDFIVTKVKGIFLFKTFRDLFEFFDKSLFGHEGLTTEEQVKRMRRYYSEEEEKKYGVCGILIEVLKETPKDIEEEIRKYIMISHNS